MSSAVASSVKTTKALVGAKLKRKEGRPTLKTPELCEDFCKRLASGLTFGAACNELGVSRETVYAWERGDSEFSDRLTRAREEQAKAWADGMPDLADKCGLTHEEIGRCRLQIQARQFIMGKHNARYSDKPGDVNVAVGVGVQLPEAQRLKLIERQRAAEALPAETETESV